jgi:Transglutaminase-like superfamily
MTAPTLHRAWPTPGSAAPLPPMAKAVLAAEILVTYVRARWLLLRCDLPGALTRLRGTDGVARTTTYDFTAVRLSHAVTRILSALPMDAKCLVRSLVLTAVLARRGIASTVVIGVRPGDGFAAHAWVETGGRAILPHEGFARLHAL